jgi:hypothetical protein
VVQFEDRLKRLQNTGTTADMRITPLEAGRRMFTIDNLGDWWAAKEGAAWMTLPSEPPAEDLHSLREANREFLFKSARD